MSAGETQDARHGPTPARPEIESDSLSDISVELPHTACPTCGAKIYVGIPCLRCHTGHLPAGFSPNPLLSESAVVEPIPVPNPADQPAPADGTFWHTTAPPSGHGRTGVTDDASRLNVLLDQIAVQSHYEDRYDIRGELARGGMGVVYRAFDRILRREVAVKMMLNPHADTNQAAVRGQFLKEARVGGRLLHPHILAVFDLGVNRDGHIYYTMRLVDGASLQNCLRALDTAINTRLVQFPLRKLIVAFLGVCRGIGYAHENGILHLDLKPANVLMSGFEEVFVIDWGLARVDNVDDTDELIDIYRQSKVDGGLTGTVVPTGAQGGRVVGTPSYMAPEQAQGEMRYIGPAADVYGLGGILHYILYGRSPNYGDTTIEVLWSSTQPKPRRPLRPGIVPAGQRVPVGMREKIVAVEAIGLKAIDPDQGARHQSVGDLILDLAEWLNAYPA